MPLPGAPPRAMEELTAYLGAFTNYETWRALPLDKGQLGPRRAERLLTRLRLLPPLVPVIQVAGSKGKGSTVLWMERLLLARGAVPGAYISPHLEHIRERIRVGGAPAPDADLLRGLADLHPHLLELERAQAGEFPTFFDLWTTLAMWIFRRAACTPILLEVGLGGPLDSTTAVPHTTGVLTTIDLEHRRELGDTMEKIAREKARIARRGRPFVLSEPGTPWAEAARAQAEAQGARVIGVSHERIPHGLKAPDDVNLAAALAALESLPGFAGFSTEEIVLAATGAEFPGRLEILAGPPALLLDSAHTPRSFALFWARVEAMRAGRATSVVISFLEGKEWEQALAPVVGASFPLAWIVTRAEKTRAVDPAVIARYLEATGATAEIVEDPDQAAELLRRHGLEGRFIAASGSFYLAGKIRSRWR